MVEGEGRKYGERLGTAWPLESGLMSRNARTLSDSKSLKEGMSPGILVSRAPNKEEIESGETKYISRENKHL